MRCNGFVQSEAAGQTKYENPPLPAVVLVKEKRDTERDFGGSFPRFCFDVLFTLCGQHKSRIRHHEQRTLNFQFIEPLGKFKAFLGVAPITFHQLCHAIPVPNVLPAFRQRCAYRGPLVPTGFSQWRQYRIHFRTFGRVWIYIA